MFSLRTHLSYPQDGSWVERKLACSLSGERDDVYLLILALSSEKDIFLLELWPYGVGVCHPPNVDVFANLEAL